jgi:cytidine deaminase
MADRKTIFEKLKILSRNAYAPYSNFKVAAAVEDAQGQLHYGVNVENQSLPLGACAEANAISAMHLAGSSQVSALYLFSDPDVSVVPCGACRQRLAEFGKPKMKIICFELSGRDSEYELADIFPNAFKFR